MSDYGDPPAAAPRRTGLRIWLLALLLAFVIGLAGAIWALTQWDAARNYLFPTPRPAVPAIAYTPPAASPTLSTQAAPTGDVAARFAGLEARLARLEDGGVGGSASRAEGLLVTFAARRAIDRGIGLGYVEGLLGQSCGATQPRAVATVVAAARQPVTLDQLRTGLAAVTPALSGSNPNGGWWDSFTGIFSGLIVVRSSDQPSPDPAARLERARTMLEAGRVDVALAEVARLPARNAAASWMADARRYLEAHRALDLLEAAAITARDGAVTSAPPATPLPDRPTNR
jgi:hypothetical protein